VVVTKFTQFQPHHLMMNHLIKFWKVYSWGIGIIIISCLPADNKGSDWLDFKHADKLMHALFYGIFSALIIISLSESAKGRFINIHKLLLAFILVLVFGSLMEIIQHYFITTRFGDPFDIIFNMLGWVVAVGLLYLRTRLFVKHQN